jgi:hypothetical protein
VRRKRRSKDSVKSRNGVARKRKHDAKNVKANAGSSRVIVTGYPR